MTKWNIVRHCGMVLLFLGILYTTSISVWNVTDERDLSEQDTANAGIKTDSVDGNKLALEKKTLNEADEPGRYVSSEKMAEPEALEEVMKRKQYPKATVTATGYTAGMESTGKDTEHSEYGITYSGVEVQRDLYSTIAADLDVYPVGTIMYIPDYGYGVVADKGSAINGDEIDLYYPTVDDVYEEWGKQDVEVYIVEMGDGSLNEKQFKALNEDDAMQVYRDEINDS